MVVQTKTAIVIVKKNSKRCTHHELEKMISLNVRDYMATDLVTLDPDTSILAAAHTLIDREISGAPVVDRDGRMVGILTERDCMRVALQVEFYGMPGGIVRDVMTIDIKSVVPGESILNVAEMFIEGTFNRYPVVDNGRLVGQISRRDVMRALGKQYPLHT